MEVVGLWCNGSTTDFDSVSSSSNLDSPSKQKHIGGPRKRVIAWCTGVTVCSCLEKETTMDEKQKLLIEILKIKTHLVKKLNMGTLRVETQDVLDKVNDLINSIEKM